MGYAYLAMLERSEWYKAIVFHLLMESKPPYYLAHRWLKKSKPFKCIMTAEVFAMCQESFIEDKVPDEVNWNILSPPHLPIWTTSRHYLTWNKKNSKSMSESSAPSINLNSFFLCSWGQVPIWTAVIFHLGTSINLIRSFVESYTILVRSWEAPTYSWQ